MKAKIIANNIQFAIISSPVESAVKLITTGKVRIGWVVCRLREQLYLKRCSEASIFMICVITIDKKGAGSVEKRLHARQSGVRLYRPQH